MIRTGEWTGHTTGIAQGYVQANLVILPKAWAFDFLLFCQRNPLACPVLEVTNTGQPCPTALAPDADLRTDLPLYRIFRKGALIEEVTDIRQYWRKDFVSFLLGCSTTFEAALLKAGIQLDHIEKGYNPPVYISNQPCDPAGKFKGPLVVSMFPIASEKVAQVVRISSRYPKAHGAPVHIGNPQAIGISDLSQPDFGELRAIGEDQIPVFWACGVTPQVVARQARPALMVTHAPGHMFLSNWRDQDIDEG